jgi:predicted nucleic acid-binding protein
VADWVIDTNVLIVATTADRGGRPPHLMERAKEDVPVKTVDDLEAVFTWLQAIRQDKQAHVVLDFPHNLIQTEYSHKILKEEYGRKVIAEKLSRCQYRMVEVERDENGDALIMHDAAHRVTDAADRRMVAAALESGAPIANACDTDWLDLLDNGTLAELGIAVHHVIESWCQAEWKRKHGKK